MLRRTSIRRMLGNPSRWLGVCVAIAVLASAGPARATGIQFAVFQQLPNSNNPYVFTNNGNGTATFTSTTQVLFNFTSASGVGDTSIKTLTLELSASTSVAATKSGTLLDQVMNGQPPVGALNTLRVYDASNTNYLTMTFTGEIYGTQGTVNATFAGDTQAGYVVNYSSAFLNFQSGASFLIGLPTVTLTNPPPPPPVVQGLQLGASGLLASFTSNAQGSFSANLAPIPEPTSAVMFGIGVLATAGLSRWRSRRSQAAER